MNKLKTIIDLVNQGDKAKLWKYLNKGIYSKKDKIDVVKSKAPQSGGGNGEGEWKYIDISNSTDKVGVLSFAQLIKSANSTMIVPAGYLSSLPADQMIAMAIVSCEIINMNGESVNLVDEIDSLISTFNCKEISKEEFYTPVIQ